MNRFIILISLHLALSVSLYGQQERKYIREGVKEYSKDEFSNAEVKFRQALDEKKDSWEASFNTGNALYKQDKPDEAADMYKQLLQKETDNNRKANLYYNLGNTLMKEKNYQQSIDAYRNALRNKPDDEDARYNLAYAMAMLQQQEKEEQNQDQQNDQQNNEQQEDNQQEPSGNKKESDEQAVEKQGVSKEEAEKILQAIENREKEVKDEVEKKQAKALSTPNIKDW